MMTVSEMSTTDAVQQIILQQPRTSVRRVASRAGLRRMTTHRIMRHNLHTFPCKIQTRQPPSLNAIDARYDFANAMLQLVDKGDIDVGNKWFSDEAYFNLDGFVNKHKWRIWETENPHVVVLSFLYSPKVMVWAAISSKGIIGPFFREQTINATKYLGIRDESVAIIMVWLDDPWNASWFMQDGARPHRTPAVFDFLSEHFSGRVIALDYDKHTGSGMACPPYSPDLKPCDFFLWGYLKDLVYRQTPQTIAELKQDISTACETIPSDMFGRLSGQFCLRLHHVVSANDGYFESIVV
ncbi:hypothetical protein AVEN_661-1 [Araneus ventricosus]|uniref:Tc1-like transposase DDE domain-containing protein n=1 Tax=Araneus ventricosus TaxID=182803 RepID=A0A4Y2BW54_ARAVE|nr:hypothetical protein AVEN_661-1 [Araneus ventricosus]